MPNYRIYKRYLTETELTQGMDFWLDEGTIPISLDVTESSHYEYDKEVIEKRWVLVCLVPSEL